MSKAKDKKPQGESVAWGAKAIFSRFLLFTFPIYVFIMVASVVWIRYQSWPVLSYFFGPAVPLFAGIILSIIIVTTFRTGYGIRKLDQSFFGSLGAAILYNVVAILIMCMLAFVFYG